MAIKITSTKQVNHYVNCMVYGESGIGKTMLCSTPPAPLILSVEGGLLTLAEKDVPVIEITKREEINEVFKWLSKSKEIKYKTICIDSLSEVAEVLLAEEMAVQKDGRQAYGKMAEVMTLLIRSFRDLPMHTVFTAKVRKIVDDNTGTIRYFPSVPGQQLLNNLPYFFDEVFRMDFGKKKDKTLYRYIDTVGSRQYICKDRSNRLAAQEPPNLTHVFNKILNTPKPVAKTTPPSKPSKPQEGK